MVSHILLHINLALSPSDDNRFKEINSLRNISGICLTLSSTNLKEALGLRNFRAVIASGEELGLNRCRRYRFLNILVQLTVKLYVKNLLLLGKSSHKNCAYAIFINYLFQCHSKMHLTYNGNNGNKKNVNNSLMI